MKKPDTEYEKRKPSYSAVVLLLLLNLCGVLCAKTFYRALSGKLSHTKRELKKMQSYYELACQWIFLKNHHKDLGDFFRMRNWKTIAIYGGGNFGQRLCEELCGAGLSVKFFIDQEEGGEILGIPVLNVEEIDTEVDVIVVTVLQAYEEIYELLRGRTKADILSLSDVVYYL